MFGIYYFIEGGGWLLFGAYGFIITEFKQFLMMSRLIMMSFSLNIFFPGLILLAIYTTAGYSAKVIMIPNPNKIHQKCTLLFLI